MKVLITGDKGFIGTNLSQYLSVFGYDILDPKQRTFSSKYDRGNSVDVNNPAELELAIMDADFVIHLAARKGSWFCEEDVKDTILTNTYGTYNVANLCARHGVPMLHYGTTAYYDTGQYMPTSYYAEDAELFPRTAYGVSKLAGEQLLKSINDLRYFVIRPVYAYGNIGSAAASRSESWPDVVAKAILDGRTLPLQTDLGGEFIKDYTFIGDICEATGKLINEFMKESGSISNGMVIQVGAEGNYPFKEIMGAFDAPFEILYDANRDYKGHQPHDYSTLKSILPDFTPSVDIMDYIEDELYKVI